MRDPTSEAIPVCRHCGAAARVGARFCSECGGTLAALTAPRSSRDPDARRERTLAAWRRLKPVMWLFGLLLGSSLLVGLSGDSSSSLLFETAIMGVDAALVFVFAAIYWEDVRGLLGLRVPSGRSVLELAVATVVFFATMQLAFGLMRWLTVPFLEVTLGYQAAHWPVWSIYLLISLTPAIYEELAFRGVIQSGLEHVVSVREAWLIQAALFSVLHLSPVIFPTHFLMGLAFGWIRLKTGSIYPGVLMHALWNGWLVFEEMGPLM